MSRNQIRSSSMPTGCRSRLGAPGLSIVDASWYLPAQGRDAAPNTRPGHIPGAMFFDQDDVVDPDSTLPHTLPRPELFARMPARWAFRPTTRSSSMTVRACSRRRACWWMFRVMGVFQVYILLDGGARPLEAARAGRSTAEPTKVAPMRLPCRFRRRPRRRPRDEMRRSSRPASARSPTRGRPAASPAPSPEPRPGVRSGHMPGATSVPATRCRSDGKLLPLDELRSTIEKAGIDLEKPIVTSCGSGVTAAVITLALESLGHKDNRLYDGSWSRMGRHAMTRRSSPGKD